MEVQKKFLSITALALYVEMDGYENALHLVGIVPGQLEALLNETEAIVKAAHIQYQYVLTKLFTKIDPEFGNRERIELITLKEREEQIEEKVHDIIKTDIDLLKYISSVPDQIQQHSFQVPVNADTPYLMNEFVTLREKEVVSILSEAYEFYKKRQFSKNFREIAILPKVTFNNTLYLNRIKKEAIAVVGNKEMEYDYKMLVDFARLFYENSQYRKEVDLKFLRANMNDEVDVNQVFYAMASIFTEEDKKMHQLLTEKINKVNDSELEELKSQPKRKAKEININYMSRRECSRYVNKFMVTVVSFMIKESEPTWSVTDTLKGEFRLYYNMFVTLLNQMIEHLVEYTQFQVDWRRRQILFSKLPLINSDNLDIAKQPITTMMYTLQYALNYLPFICSATHFLSISPQPRPRPSPNSDEPMRQLS